MSCTHEIMRTLVESARVQSAAVRARLKWSVSALWTTRTSSSASSVDRCWAMSARRVAHSDEQTPRTSDSVTATHGVARDAAAAVGLRDDGDRGSAAVVRECEGKVAAAYPHAVDFHAARLAERDGVEVEATGGRVRDDAERRLHQVKRRARPPGLRVARHQVL